MAIKFRDSRDQLAFLVESGRVDLLEVPVGDWDTDLSEVFFKKQHDRATGLVDFRKSQLSKRQWRQNRWKMMRGIDKFHRSVKGKKFHRSLGRFIATRIFEPKRISSLMSLRAEALKAVSSLRTHLYIESEFYMPLEESVNFLIFFEYAVPLLAQVEEKIFNDRIEEIDVEEIELLLRLTEVKEVIKGCQAVGAPSEKIQSFEEVVASTDHNSLDCFTNSLGFIIEYPIETECAMEA